MVLKNQGLQVKFQGSIVFYCCLIPFFEHVVGSFDLQVGDLSKSACVALVVGWLFPNTPCSWNPFFLGVLCPPGCNFYDDSSFQHSGEDDHHHNNHDVRNSLLWFMQPESPSRSIKRFPGCKSPCRNPFSIAMCALAFFQWKISMVDNLIPKSPPKCPSVKQKSDWGDRKSVV